MAVVHLTEALRNSIARGHRGEPLPPWTSLLELRGERDQGLLARWPADELDTEGQAVLAVKERK